MRIAEERERRGEGTYLCGCTGSGKAAQQLAREAEDGLLVAEHLHQVYQHVRRVGALRDEGGELVMSGHVEQHNQGVSAAGVGVKKIIRNGGIRVRFAGK